MNLIELRLQLAEPVELHVELLADFVKLILYERQYFGGSHLRPRRACGALLPARARRSACANVPTQPLFSRLTLRPATFASAHKGSDYHTT